MTLPAIREQAGVAPLFPKFWAWFCTPTYALGRIPWRQLKAMIPRDLLAKTPNETQMSIELVNGALIEFKSTDNPEGLYGSGLDLLCVDEAAMVDDEAWNEALRPRLASFGRVGLAAIASTPKGQRGWFHEMFLAGQNPANEEVWSMQAAMKDSGMVSDSEIESLRRTMPQLAFEQEVLGKFITDSGAVFRNIEGCRIPPEPVTPGGCTIGVDLASRRDRTALVAIDPTGLVFGIDAFTGMSWQSVIDRIANFIERSAPVKRVVIERNGVGDPIHQDIEREFGPRGIHVEGFLTTAASKRQIIESLALAIEHQSINWVADAPHVREFENELALFEFTSTSTGFRYSGRGTAHDDLVMAAALAWSGCEVSPRRWQSSYCAVIDTSAPPLRLTGGMSHCREAFGFDSYSPPGTMAERVLERMFK